MVALSLLLEAQAAGLQVSVGEGGRLVIRGPRTAADLAQRLLEAKPTILEVLDGRSTPGASRAPRPDTLSPEALAQEIQFEREWAAVPLAAPPEIEKIAVGPYRGFLVQKTPPCPDPARREHLAALATAYSLPSTKALLAARAVHVEPAEKHVGGFRIPAPRKHRPNWRLLAPDGCPWPESAYWRCPKCERTFKPAEYVPNERRLCRECMKRQWAEAP